VAVAARAPHHLDLLQADRHQAVLAVQAHPVDLHQVVRVVDLHLPVQVLPVHPVRIAMAHHQAVVLQVVVTHPIAAPIQVDHQLHAVTHPAHLHDQVQIVVIVQPVVPTVIEIPVQVHVRHQIVQPVVHTATEIPVRHHAQAPIAANAVTVHEIPVRHQIVQLAVHTEIVTHVRHQIVAHRQTVANVAQVPIDQQVAHTVTEIPVLARDQVQIVQRAVIATDQNVALRVDRQIDAMALLPVHRAIAQPVAHMVIATHVHLHVQVQIDHVAKTHTVAIAHARAMTAIHVRLRVTANVVDVQIVPEVVSPMIAKNVHAVALAKSA